MRSSVLLMAAMSFVATSAQAEPPKAAVQKANLNQSVRGYSYFNRPGADEAAHDDAVRRCFMASSVAVSLRAHFSGSASGRPGKLVDRMFDSWAANSSAKVNLENCMVALGWRVIGLPTKAGAEIARLAPAEQRLRLKAWLGAENPDGEVMRVWANEGIRSSTIVDKIDPGPVGKVSLSLTSLQPIIPPGTEPPAPRTGNPIFVAKSAPSVDLAKLGTLPENSALLLFYATRNVRGQFVTRVGPDGLSATLVDGREDMTGFGLGGFGKPAIAAIILPPGRWRIAGIGLFGAMDFCLGAPFFDVAAGDVVYAGAFGFAPDSLAPDMSLEPAVAALAGRDDLLKKLKPAPWMNGSTAQCGATVAMSFLYALEYPGFPFAEDYTAGNRAQPSASLP